MKVWIINHYATPPERGSSTRHYALARELAKYGHQVTVIAADKHHLVNRHYPKSASRSIELWQDKTVEFLFLPTPDYQGNGIKRLWNMLCFAWQILQLQKKIDKEPPDILIGSSVHLFAVWAAERLAERFQIPFCFEVRDLWPQTLIDMRVISKYHPLSIILGYLEKYLYKKANIILTLLPYSYEYISQFDIAKNRIEYLPNGVELDQFMPGASFNNPQEKITVMYLGSHGPANGLNTLVEAAAELEKNLDKKQIYWRLIGEGPQKQQLQSQVEQLGLKTLNFENSIPKNEVPQKIAEADILVFHLRDLDVFRYGVSPNKLFDYLASQRPVVFACAARNNPVAEANAGITVPPENPKAMADAIQQLASLSQQERAEMGHRGRTYVEQYHSYTYLGKRLNTLLEEVVLQR